MRCAPRAGRGRGWRITPRGEYPPDWAAIAEAVKDAAGWCCIRCRHPHAVEGWYILTVHHLDGDKGNAAWWNLLALCQRCHLSVQARVNPQQPYLLEHTPWFLPYVAGFYAAEAGVLVARVEIEADPHRYLALGQPWLYPALTR